MNTLVLNPWSDLYCRMFLYYFETNRNVVPSMQGMLIFVQI